MFSFGREWLSKKSLTTKLAVSILGSVLCGVVALLIFFEHYSTEILSSHIQETAEKSLQRAVSSIEETAVEMEQATENNLNIFSSTDDEVIRDLMRSTVQTMDYEGSDFGSVWVYVFEPDTYRQGMLYMSEKQDNEIKVNKIKIDDLYETYPWFKEVPKEEKIFLTELGEKQEFTILMSLIRTRLWRA